jgi:peptidoglycan-associated lipoprotein
MKKLILSVVLVNLLAACSSAPTKPDVAEVPPTNTSANTDTAVPQAAADAAAAKAAADAAAAQAAADAAAAKAAADAAAAQAAADAAAAQAAADAAALSKSSVYFATDVDAVQASDKELLLAHGKKLAGDAQSRVRVEGNADERGSSEYNLALGQRRAKNTKKVLVLSGAKANQVTTVSYGEEKPAATGHDEAAWSQNRRVDINYNAGK